MDLLTGFEDLGGLLLDYVLPFLVVLTILVFVHEWGHYWVARRCGVRIDVFSIGFGRELFGWNDKSGTRWQVSALPLGGYVKMYGDADATSLRQETGEDPPAEEGGMHHFADPHAAPKPMTAEQKAQSFHYKPLWQRAAIVAAGPAANFIFAVIALAFLFGFIGQPTTSPVIGFVDEGSVAEEIGLQVGDRVLAVDGRSVRRFEQVDQAIRINQGERMRLELERSGERFEVEVTPRLIEITNRLGTQEVGDLGIWPVDLPLVGSVQEGSAADAAGFEPSDRILAIDGRSLDRFTELQEIVADRPGETMTILVARNGGEVTLTATPQPVTVTADDGSEVEIGRLGITRGFVQRERHGPVTAVIRAVEETANLTVTTLKTVGQILTGSRPADQIGGPLRIAQMSGETAAVGVASLITFMALLSINLGLINLFPIPMLDGGHLLFYGIEAVRGRPLGPKAQEFGFRVGLALVLSLAAFALWNDLVQLQVFQRLSDLVS